jgi:hypothetical protein
MGKLFVELYLYATNTTPEDYDSIEGNSDKGEAEDGNKVSAV